MARRYARSLFELAQEENAAEKVETELNTLAQALKESREFRLFADSPVMTAQEKITVLRDLLPKLQIKNLTSNFVLLLAKNRRLMLLSEAIIAYRQLAERGKGRLSAEIASAEPLSQAQAQALKDALKETTGKDVALDAHVDQSLIGGLIVKLGSRMLDTSLKTKLANLKIALKGIS